MTYREFDTAKELVDFFLEKALSPPRDLFQTVEKGFLYRGQASAEWPLVPSAHRRGSPLREFTPQVPGTDPPWKGPSLSFGMQLHAELRAVFLFMEQADRLGIRTSLDYSTTRLHRDQIEAAMGLGKGGEEAPAHELSEPFPDPVLIPDIALAQHYGVPTRLLDWTESPLVAAYFAAYEHSSLSKGSGPTTERCAVYRFDSRRWANRSPCRRISAPRHLNRNMLAQKGAFTIRDDANAYLLEHGKWPSMTDDPLDDQLRRSSIQKITLPASEADDLLRLLFRYDVTRYHLEPSLRQAASAFQYRRALFGGGD